MNSDKRQGEVTVKRDLFFLAGLVLFAVVLIAFIYVSTTS